MSSQWPSPDQPFAVKAINKTGRLLRAFGINSPAINVSAIQNAAKKEAGLSDYGSGDYLTGLEHLVYSLNHEAQLSQIGRAAAKRMLVNALVARMQIADHVNRHPEITEQKIERPIFIMALPRTGTTILHSIIAEDPRHRSPLLWEMQCPYPPCKEENHHNDPRIEELEKTSGKVEMLAPGMNAIHESNPRLAEECLPMLATAFFQEQYSTVYRMPGYREWYMNTDAKPAYEWHKIFLQYLQANYRSRRWALKSPMHLPFLETILDIYPDAQFIQTHREPLKVLGSLSSLSCTLRSAFSDNIDPVKFGQEESIFFADVVQRGIVQRDRINRPEIFYDYQFDDVINRPIDAIADLYEYFGWEFTSEARVKMQHFIDNRPRTKHGKHSYSLEQFGISEAVHSPMFAEYRKRYVRSVL